MEVIDRQTGEKKSAIYATTPKGNKRMNVDGKFYTDKMFDKKFRRCDIEIESGTPLMWRVHLPNFLKEIMNNPGTGILRVPMRIFQEILIELGDRCAELNDPKLNAIMCRLAIYSISDPENPNYDKDLNEQTIAKGYPGKTIKK